MKEISVSTSIVAANMSSSRRPFYRMNDVEMFGSVAAIGMPGDDERPRAPLRTKSSQGSKTRMIVTVNTSWLVILTVFMFLLMVGLVVMAYFVGYLYHNVLTDRCIPGSLNPKCPVMNNAYGFSIASDGDLQVAGNLAVGGNFSYAGENSDVASVNQTLVNLENRVNSINRTLVLVLNNDTTFVFTFDNLTASVQSNAGNITILYNITSSNYAALQNLTLTVTNNTANINTLSTELSEITYTEYVSSNSTVLSPYGTSMINCADQLTGLTLPNASTPGIIKNIILASRQCLLFGIALQRGTIVMGAHLAHRQMVYIRDTWQSLGSYDSYVPTRLAASLNTSALSPSWGANAVGMPVALSPDGNMLWTISKTYAYLWQRTATSNWAYTGTLINSIPLGADPSFTSISMSADTSTVVFGIEGSGPFISIDGVVSQSGLFIPGNQSLLCEFDSAVSSNGSVVACAAPNNTYCANLGAAVVWYDSGGNWSRGQVLLGGEANCSYGLYQGQAVAMSADGSVIVSGMFPLYTDESEGSVGAYVFRMTSPGRWTQTGYIQPGNFWSFTDAYDSLVSTTMSMDITADGTTIVMATSLVAANTNTLTYFNVASLLVYHLSETTYAYNVNTGTYSATDTWELTANMPIYLNHNSGTQNMDVSTSISDDGNTITVFYGPGTTSVLTYVYTGEMWIQFSEVTLSNSAYVSPYAMDMTSDGRTVVVATNQTPAGILILE